MGTVYILAGLPGSGKSTWARQYGGTMSTIVSADHFFERSGGKYNFDFTKLGEAHGECLKTFVEALIDGHSHVFVDNTNTTIPEIAPYYALARAYGYKVELHLFLCSEEVSFRRNIHNVPMKSIEMMRKRFDTLVDNIPTYWDIVVKHNETQYVSGCNMPEMIYANPDPDLDRLLGLKADDFLGHPKDMPDSKA